MRDLSERQYRSCDACGGPPAFHPQTHLQFGFDWLDVCVDEGVAELVAACAGHGIWTLGSCQGDDQQPGYVQFDSVESAQSWVMVMEYSDLEASPLIHHPMVNGTATANFEPSEIPDLVAAFDEWRASWTTAPVTATAEHSGGAV